MRGSKKTNTSAMGQHSTNKIHQRIIAITVLIYYGLQYANILPIDRS